ncbi:Phosphonate ABC transporter phosphate-binding periplasmic component [Rhodovulum sp. P5]|uniref:phosphate/phosphite/phosphonate ABC transporter substrate-binding protein n=1 Tax=Rhodovulum sp. P5 TaxID=1564506 RepID=UPI0009C304F6|nr:phosphate/phosphite/phosphonate ABC transporter substrate-binding protein [Rhodovulum sp. P5]ARE38627.1 Phosphonate ABC transporter phosphate-binding periplasmic component [Rhodovulum sp. P5]
MRPTRHSICLAAAIALASFTEGSAAADQEPLVLGVVPQQSAKEILARWAPLATFLEERLGQPVALQVSPDIPSFEACVAAGAYDIAYMNPFHYTTYHDLVGYEGIAHRAEKRLKGIMVVAADSPMQALSELDGEKIAFPSPGAFAASVVQRAELNEQGIGYEPVYVRSHVSVYKTVAQGIFPAGGGIQRTLNALEPDLRAKLRVIHTTTGYTPHAFAVHPRVSGETSAEIAGLLAGLAAEQPDIAAGLAIGAIVPADDASWDDVRSLDITAEHAGLALDPAPLDRCR